MEGAAVQKIVDLVLEGVKVSAADREFIHPALVDANAERRVAPIRLRSLTGFVGFIKENIDLLDLEKHIVVVDSPTVVSFCSALSERDRARDVVVRAEASPPGFPFGEFKGLEEFNILVQSRIVAGDDRAEVLRLVGNVTDEAVKTEADDGVTQRVTARVGVSRVEDAEVPNPVTLRPYRTFLEVEQPASPFILRLRTGAGQAPVTAALFEADGGAWKDAAVQAVVQYVGVALGGPVQVVG